MKRFTRVTVWTDMDNGEEWKFTHYISMRQLRSDNLWEEIMANAEDDDLDFRNEILEGEDEDITE